MTKFITRNKSVLFKWIISYILVFLIPLVIFGGFYGYMERVMADNAMRYNATFIDSSIQNIEEINTQISLNNNRLAMNNKIAEFASLQGEPIPKQIYEIREISAELRTSMVTLNRIYDMFIYFPQIDRCVYQNGNMSSRDFYQQFYHGIDTEFPEWKARLMESSFARQQRERIYGITTEAATDCIAFIQPFPLASKDINAVCVTWVRKSEMTKALYERQGEDHFTGFILLDSRENVIIESGWGEIAPEEVETLRNAERRRIDGEECYVLKTELTSPNWTIYAKIPMKQIYKELRGIQMWMMVLLVFYLMICGILVVKLSYRNYIPIKQLLGHIAEKLDIVYDKNINEYSLIEQAFQNVISRRQETISFLEKRGDALRQNFLNSVLKGNCSQEDWEASLREFDIQFEGDKFLVIMFQIEDVNAIFPDDEKLDSVERQRIGNLIVSNIGAEVFQVENYVLFTSIKDLPVCIVNLSQTRVNSIPENIKEALLDIQKAVRNYFSFHFTAAVSGIHDTYVGISEAYTEAIEAMEHRVLYDEDAIIFYKDLVIPDTGTYYYSLENERILINYIKSGRFESAQRVIDEIYDINLKNNIMPLPLVKCLMFDMVSTMIKTLNEISSNSKEKFAGSSDSVNRLLKCENIYEMQKVMRQILSEVCDFVNAKDDHRIQQQVLEIVQENYSNNQLSVASIADYLGINPSYLSTVFKEKTGERPLDYIMRYRIERAKELFLQDASVSVEEIANRVGYDNIRTFVRIFKKYEGITPAQYRTGNNAIE